MWRSLDELTPDALRPGDQAFDWNGHHGLGMTNVFHQVDHSLSSWRLPRRHHSEHLASPAGKPESVHVQLIEAIGEDQQSAQKGSSWPRRHAGEHAQAMIPCRAWYVADDLGNCAACLRLIPRCVVNRAAGQPDASLLTCQWPALVMART